jgi:putative GTP pyrophosphokinase
MNRDELSTAFQQTRPSYCRLADNLKNALIQFLCDSGIDYVDVETRVKTFDSFSSKAERKGYKDPLVETTDVCGLRIINYYPSDLEKIASIINSEFDVIESSNKEEEMDEDRFGYRSLHFIACLNKDWLAAPNYRGLGGLKFEIQARTILMHGWAAISHKLAYKHERDVPKKFRRDLFRLSALIEMADEQFERLRAERKKYIDSFVESSLESGDIFVPQEELNTDSLQALLDYYFPDRAKRNISSLVSEIDTLGMNLYEFNSAVKSVIQHLDEIEKEESTATNEAVRWAQEGAARTVLDLTNSEYFLRHENSPIPEELLEVVKSWRKKINKVS